jgi:hypothetical protein
LEKEIHVAFFFRVGSCFWFWLFSVSPRVNPQKERGRTYQSDSPVVEGTTLMVLSCNSHAAAKTSNFSIEKTLIFQALCLSFTN